MVAQMNPETDGPRVFDPYPRRRDMAMACQAGPRTIAQLQPAVRAPDAPTRGTADKLVEYGVLRELPATEPRTLAFNPQWSTALREARRRASKGITLTGQRLLCVPSHSLAAAVRYLAATTPDQHLAWAATVQDGGLLLVLHEDAADTDVKRLQTTLAAQSIETSSLTLGEIAGFQELRGMAARMSPDALPQPG